METINPWGVAKFDPRGMNGTIYFREEDFLIFSHSKSIETINLRGLAKFDPRGMNGTIYVEDH